MGALTVTMSYSTSPLFGPVVPEIGWAPPLRYLLRRNRVLKLLAPLPMGTLLEVGRGKKPVEWILQVLQEKNRSMAGHSVPAEGLFLWKVNYENLKTID